MQMSRNRPWSSAHGSQRRQVFASANEGFFDLPSDKTRFLRPSTARERDRPPVASITTPMWAWDDGGEVPSIMQPSAPATPRPPSVPSDPSARSRRIFSSALVRSSKESNGVRIHSARPTCAVVVDSDAWICRRPPPSILQLAPEKWTPNSRTGAAINQFDYRHRQLFVGCNRLQDALRPDPTSHLKGSTLGVGICELGRNRFHVREEAPVKRRATSALPPKHPKPQASAPKAWTLVDSIWGPRRKAAASEDYYDTLETKERKFARDWNMASERLNLAKKLSRATREVPETDGAHLLETMHSSMAKFVGPIYQVFFVYASKGLRPDDVYCIELSSYFRFIRDLRLVDHVTRGRRDEDMQVIFEATTGTGLLGTGEDAGERVRHPDPSKTASPAADDEFKLVQALSRHEWIGALVQIIMQRYVLGRTMRLDEAVLAFFEDDLRPNVQDECFQDPNTFRSGCCYLESTDLVLKMYEPSLRAVYDAFARWQDTGDGVPSPKLFDFNEYTKFISRLNLIGPGLMTMHDLRMPFFSSLMEVVDDSTTKGRIRSVQLDFEGFLELLVRLAFMMPLPTDQEIFDLGVEHAGEYLDELEKCPVEAALFYQQRRRRLGLSLDQPIAHKVRHFIEWMLYSVRGGSDEVSKAISALPITKKDVERFRYRRSQKEIMKAKKMASLKAELLKRVMTEVPAAAFEDFCAERRKLAANAKGLEPALAKLKELWEKLEEHERLRFERAATRRLKKRDSQGAYYDPDEDPDPADFDFLGADELIELRRTLKAERDERNAAIDAEREAQRKARESWLAAQEEITLQAEPKPSISGPDEKQKQRASELLSKQQAFEYAEAELDRLRESVIEEASSSTTGRVFKRVMTSVVHLHVRYAWNSWMEMAWLRAEAIALRKEREALWGS